MADKTRVRISYTVDLDEVPSRISALISESAMRLIKQGNALKAIATRIEDNDGVDKTVGNDLDDVRVCMSGIDLQLDDCHNLLASYANAQLQLMTKAPVQDADSTPSPETVEEE